MTFIALKLQISFCQDSWQYRWTPLRVLNRIEVQMHDPWMLVETTRVTEFEYYFACTCKDVHLRFIMSPNRVTLTFDFLDHESIPNQDLSVSSLLPGTSLSAFHSLYVNNVQWIERRQTRTSRLSSVAAPGFADWWPWGGHLWDVGPSITGNFSFRIVTCCSAHNDTLTLASCC